MITLSPSKEILGQCHQIYRVRIFPNLSSTYILQLYALILAVSGVLSPPIVDLNPVEHDRSVLCPDGQLYHYTDNNTIPNLILSHRRQDPSLRRH